MSIPVSWKNFNREKVIAEVELRVRAFVIPGNEAKEAAWFVNWLAPVTAGASEFAREAPEMVARYERVILQCKFIALGLLSWDDIEEVFEKHIMTLFEMPDYYELLPRIKGKLLAEPEYETRDEIKKRLREALLRNPEYFVDYLQIEEEGQVAKPATVGNFLHNYIAAVGLAPAESIKRSEYLAKNKNVEKLKAEDRKKFEQLIALFERLKLSSLTPEGLEEHVSTEIDGKAVVFKEGRFEDEIEPRVLEIIKKMKEAGFFPGSDTGKTAEPVAQNAQKTETSTPLLSALPAPSVQPAMKRPSVASLHDDHPLRVELEEVVESVMQNVKLKIQNFELDAVLQKRFRTIVSARLREVRDASETAAMLERPVKVGGMGLGKQLQEVTGGYKKLQEVDPVSDIIEKAFAEFQEKWKTFEKKRIEEWKQKQRGELEARHAQGVKKEQEDLEARYRKLVGTAKPQKNVTKITESVSVSSAQKVSVVLPPPLPPPPKPLPPPPPPKPVLPTRSVPKAISVPSVRPVSVVSPPGKVTDVRMPPKLTGPLEELKGLTLEDFRRLGSPEEAAAKINARIELLGKESLRRRIDGIKAWQVCEVNRIYQAITATSFSERKNMLQVLEERKGRNMPALTPDEFHVIMELNQKLRF